MATYHEVAVLQRGYNHEELISALDLVRGKIADWKQSYSVKTPGELRVSITDLSDASEVGTRREVAGEREHLADRVPIIRAALNGYDRTTKRDFISV